MAASASASSTSSTSSTSSASSASCVDTTYTCLDTLITTEEIDITQQYGSLYGTQALYLANYICNEIEEKFIDKTEIKILEFGYKSETYFSFKDLLIHRLKIKYPKKNFVYIGIESFNSFKHNGFFSTLESWYFNLINKSKALSLLSKDLKKHQISKNIYDIFIMIAPLFNFMNLDITKTNINNIETVYESYNIFKEQQNKFLKIQITMPDLFSFISSRNFNDLYVSFLFSLILNKYTLFFQVHSTQIGDSSFGGKLEEFERIKNLTIDYVNSDTTYTLDHAINNYNLPFARNPVWTNQKEKLLMILSTIKYYQKYNKIRYKVKYIIR